MNNLQSLIVGVFFILMITFVIVTQLNQSKDEEKLSQKFGFTYGTIVKFRVESRYSSPGKYRFSLDDKVYNEIIINDPFCDTPTGEDKHKILSMRFPVVYSPIDPKINRVLLDRKSYQKFGFEYPDSIKWISDRYFICE